MIITYIKNGDYLLPNLKVKDTTINTIGKYGFLRLNYLKENKNIEYQQLLMEGKLTEYLINIDKISNERIQIIIGKLSENTIFENLKEFNQFKWIRLMNNYKIIAEESIFSEIIYI